VRIRNSDVVLAPLQGSAVSRQFVRGSLGTLCRALLETMLSSIVWLIETARLVAMDNAPVPTCSCARRFGTSARFHGVVATEQQLGHLNGS
jgi:hypothetical protein